VITTLNPKKRAAPVARRIGSSEISFIKMAPFSMTGTLGAMKKYLKE